MTPELYQRLKPLFEKALELSADKRAAFVDEACKGDTQLRKDLQDLLDAHDAKTETLDHPIFNVHALISPREQTFADGTVLLGRFRIVKLLGSGGMGEVYEAIDTHLGRIALKTVIGDITASPERLLRFRKEVQLARDVSNPHVCRIHELFLTEGSDGAFVTMEFLNGVTLADKIRESGPLPWREVRTVALQLCEALQSIHEAEIIHRDLKTRNIMLATRAASNTTVLMDFGIARRLSHQSGESSTGITIDGAIIGTPDYMAPEQFQGKETTPATDIYALGVVLYEIATGKRPVRDDPNNARNGKPKPLARPSSLQPGIPRRFDEVVCKCLEFDPRRRYQSAKELERAIRLPSLLLHIQQKPLTAAASMVGSVALLSSLLLIPAIGERAIGIVFSSHQKHIAMLPFDETGTSPEIQALGDGLMDSLSGQLANLDTSNQTLWVVPASEVRLRKVRNPSSALKEFAVTIVVEGRFERDDITNHLKLTLIDPEHTREIGYIEVQSAASDLALLQDEAVTRLGRLMNISTAQTSEHGRGEATDRVAYEDYLTGLGYYERYDLPGNIDLAIQALERSVARDTTFSSAYATLAQAYATQFQGQSDPSLLQHAERNARKAFQLDNRASATYVALGQVDQFTSNDDAISDFQHAVSLDPGDPDAVKGLANSLQNAGRHTEAEATYTKAIALRPDYWKGYNELGNFYESTGRPRDAILQYNKALQQAPGSSWIYSNLGDAYMDLDDTQSLQQAEEFLKKSISIDPGDDIVLANLGDLYLMKHQFEDSVEASRAAIRLNEKRSSTWYNLALAYEWLKNTREADLARERSISLLESALRRNPGNYQAVATLASLYARAGDRKRAQEQIPAALAAGSGDQLTCLQVADAYALLGDRHKATLYLQKAVSLGLNKTRIAVYTELTSL